MHILIAVFLIVLIGGGVALGLFGKHHEHKAFGWVLAALTGLMFIFAGVVDQMTSGHH